VPFITQTQHHNIYLAIEQKMSAGMYNTLHLNIISLRKTSCMTTAFYITSIDGNTVNKLTPLVQYTLSHHTVCALCRQPFNFRSAEIPKRSHQYYTIPYLHAVQTRSEVALHILLNKRFNSLYNNTTINCHKASTMLHNKLVVHNCMFKIK